MESVIQRLSERLSSYLHTDMRFFLSGGFWLTALQIIGLAGGLITSIVYTNLLDTSTYGTYKYLISLGVLLATFSLTGIPQALQQAAIKRYPGFYDFAKRKTFIFSLGITAVALVMAGYYWVKGDAVLALGCLVLAILQPINIVYQNIMSFLMGERKFKRITLFQTGDTIVTTLIIVAALFITHNIVVLLIVYLLSQIGGNFLMDQLYRPRQTEHVPAEITTKYYKYAWHTTIRNSIFNVAFRLDNIVVFTHLGAADLAIYSIANLIPEQIKGSFKNLSSLLLVRYAKHDDLSIIKKTMLRRSIQLFSLLTMITIGYILIAPSVYHLLFPKYAASIFYSQLAALSFPAFIAIIPTSALQAQIKEKKLHYLNLLNSVSLLFFVIIFTYAFGLIGTIYARIIYRYLNVVTAYYFIYTNKT